ncbi:MAG TPA: MerR family transcriptional regulator [Acidimicrobiales bacterium]|nr:MerR family transcriptional regulator [Acidimicrobiales bacterium]
MTSERSAEPAGTERRQATPAAGLLLIGELSARSGISRSALRFYDECGVIRPVVVDEANGYRWYGAGQVATAVLIGRLRDAGLGVAAIRAYLVAGPGGRDAILDRHLEHLEVRHASLLAAVRLLRSGEDATVGSDPTAASPRSWEAATLGGSDLAEALRQVLPAAGGPDQPALEGVLVEVKDWSLRLVATDSYRLAIRDLVPVRVLVAMRCLVRAAHLARLLPSIAAASSCGLSATASGALRLDLDGSPEVLDALEAEFPDYEQVLEGRAAGWSCLVGRDELAAAVEATLPGAPAAALPLCFRARGLRAGATVIEHCWEGPDLDVLLNRRFVADALAACSGPDVVIEAAGAISPVTIRSADSGTFNVWIMPIRP